MTLKNNEKKTGHTYKQWAVTFLANAAFLSYGMQGGWVSPMTKILLSDESPVGRALSNEELSWVGSVPSLAGVFGASVAAYIVDKYGRKIGVMSVAFLQGLCWLIKLLPSTPETLILARVFCGLAGGGTFNVVPVYVKEVCQDDIRGVAGLVIMMSQNIGILAIFTMGAYLDYYTVLSIAVVVPILNIILMFFAPESPAYLVKIGKVEEAAATIANLRGLDVSDKAIQNEMDLIKSEDDAFKSIKNVTILSVLRQPAWRRGIILMTCIIFAHASNGAFSIITYASSVLKSSGVTMSPELLSLSIPVFMIFASLVSMSLVERLGRKPIFVTTFILSAISLACLATILLVQQQGVVVPGWLPVVAIVVTVCCYAGGVSPLPFVVMSEMFNFQVRTKIICGMVTMAWFESFVQLSSFRAIASAYGAHVAFYIFILINIFGAICIIVFLPETKGKTVEQIEKELVSRKIC